MIEETDCLTVATSAFIIYGAEGIKKFSLAFIYFANGEIQLKSSSDEILLFGSNSQRLQTTPFKISEYDLLNLN